MESIRCPHCRRLLLRADKDAISGRIEVKCPRCKAFTVLQAQRLFTERPAAQSRAAPDRDGGE